MLAAGPAVSAFWAMALIINWAWPVPIGVRVVLGSALVTVIRLLAAAAFGLRYRLAMHAGAAGCAGLTALDATMLLAVTFAVLIRQR